MGRWDDREEVGINTIDRVDKVDKVDWVDGKKDQKIFQLDH